MSSSNWGLLASLSALAIYAFSMYYLTFEMMESFEALLPKPLQVYGHWKFLTVQCLGIQLISALLHVVAHFFKPLRGLRDLVFTGLAFPIGSIAVYSFWLVWFGMGREFIFPTKYDAFYPLWLNHATHTVIVPINFLLASIIKHKYHKYGAVLTLTYMLSYVILLHVIKAQTGLFVYGYIEKLSDIERFVYYAATGLFAYLMFKFGWLVTNLAHGSEQVAVSSSKQTKGQPALNISSSQV